MVRGKLSFVKLLNDILRKLKRFDEMAGVFGDRVVVTMIFCEMMVLVDGLEVEIAFIPGVEEIGASE